MTAGHNLKTYIDGHRRALEQLITLEPEISAAARACIEALRGGGKLLTCGNGGSAADAQHFAAELTGRYRRERRPLPALALTTDSSALTCIGNDYAFEDVFARQVRALVQQGDVLIGITTSGNSANVVRALQAGREQGAITIALTGEGGGQAANHADITLRAPSDRTAHIQEMHILMIHVLCETIDDTFVEATPA
ncbi:D-sedoheptulose 7-phosphate isomerase [Deinococcus peraridilitoris]|uniref:Phosphoheptose isomerase n=1 Tax=Deinococcus peraridilitoris (strain DSM 19664 / LMG 22246 / CIP 109416 / KR-200) TaxID=937777 RepID=K9ZVU5_DEIPD|nr:D-sedoheptulose 7-phosphate isomerase [Deinococcus peraridilitoris]AFZ65656.1 phosphoheptose isomerase [Deinococcus peraridilitoris DSM 19664]